MSLLTRRSVVLAKIESNYGTDASPGTADAILCTAPSVTPAGDLLTRDFVRSSISPYPHVIGAKTVEVTFDTEIKGSGTNSSTSTSDIIPEIGVLLRACGLSETVTYSSTSGTPATFSDLTAAYQPVSTNFESATIYVYFDGVLHKVVGCRGTAVFTLDAGAFPRISWTFRGLYQDVVDASMVTGEYDDTQPPIVESLGLKLDSYSPKVQSITIDLANTLTEIRDVNESEAMREITITNRDTNGRINPEMELVATYDFFGIWKNATKKSLSCTIGSTGGNKIIISCPTIQENSLAYADRDGIRALDIPIKLASESGDNEITIKFV